MYVIEPLKNINYGATGVEEILQNVAFIMSTFTNSCPLDREFGYNPPIDEPITLAPHLNMARITDAITKFEPRVQVLEVYSTIESTTGQSTTNVKVTINESI